MIEFNDRMQAQRRVVELVNRRCWKRESLFGLSTKAIDRWVTSNVIDPSSRLVELVRSVSAELLCLATKSQEQVASKDSIMRLSRIESLTTEIEGEIAKGLVV